MATFVFSPGLGAMSTISANQTVHNPWFLAKEYGEILQDCSELPPPPSVYLRSKGDLLALWPQLKDANNFAAGKKFWNHERMKHGSCSQFSALKYFTHIINLARTYDEISMLKSEDIIPNDTFYDSQHIINAMIKCIKYQTICS